MWPLLARALAAGRGFMAGQGRANSFAQSVMNGGFGRAGNSFQQGAQGGGGALGGLYQAAKDAAPPLIKLGMEIAEIPGKIQEWGRQLVESQRYLSQYNGTIAGATAQLDADRIRRDIQLGRATSGSFQDLTQSQSRLEEAMQPARELWADVKNTVQSWLNNLGAGIMEGTNGIAVEAAKALGIELKKDDVKDDPFINQAFHSMADNIRKQNRQPLPKL